MLPQPAGDQRCFPKFDSQNINKNVCLSNLFPIGENVLIVKFPILINKDVFEPSYNDLKFTVQNCNYVCTNLIYWMLMAAMKLKDACSLDRKLRPT